MTTTTTEVPTLEERARAYLNDGRFCCITCTDVHEDARLANAVCDLLLADAVARLDAVVPDWRTRVDPDRLDMDDLRRCVIGQVFGDYGRGVDELYGPIGHGPGDAAFLGGFPVESWRELLVTASA